MSVTPPRPRPMRQAMRNLALLVLLAIGLAFAALPRIERYFITETAAREEATLRLATASLRGTLARSEALPALLAERPILSEILRDPGNEGLLPFANEQLRQTARTLELADIFVMDLSGTTIAASNYRREASFVGRNFAYRPYFTDALSMGRGRFHALGVTSGQRGYYFAAPIIDNTEVLGVVAVKILLEGFEQTWRDGDNTIIVTDSSNVIFLSDREDWHFRTIGPVPEPATEAIAQTRQYPLNRLSPLPLSRESLGPTTDLLRIGDSEEYVTNVGLIAAAGWRVWVLTPTRPAILQARQTLASIILVILFAGLVGALFLQRRARLLERLDQQRHHREVLEARVTERTADLHDANAQLRQEVEERRMTEARLRKTQNDLVQAGKLAALGQMSAALSHEFNQPLAAVKSYADNAATFLDRDRPEEARRNIGLISQMADRMAAISKHLRNFARRPQERIGPVPLVPVLDDALALMRARLAEAGVEIRYDRPEGEIMVMGGQVRLQQVLVNLLSNAIDAMEDQATPVIEITVEARDGRWQVQVRDHGPGLSEASLAQLFDPFFTTKSPGKGLGLGLSISYNIVRDFGGSLDAHNHVGGGAVFVVDLAPASNETEIAAQ